MVRRPRFQMHFEVERARDTVEYLAMYSVTPAEPMRGPSRDSPGEPGCGAEVEDVEVFFERRVLCEEHRFKHQGRQGCRACRVVLEPRPELVDLVDEDELLEHANETAEDDHAAAAEARADQRRDDRLTGDF